MRHPKNRRRQSAFIFRPKLGFLIKELLFYANRQPSSGTRRSASGNTISCDCLSGYQLGCLPFGLMMESRNNMAVLQYRREWYRGPAPTKGNVLRKCRVRPLNSRQLFPSLNSSQHRPLLSWVLPWLDVELCNAISARALLN